MGTRHAPFALSWTVSKVILSPIIQRWWENIISGGISSGSRHAQKDAASSRACSAGPIGCMVVVQCRADSSTSIVLRCIKIGDMHVVVHSIAFVAFNCWSPGLKLCSSQFATINSYTHLLSHFRNVVRNVSRITWVIAVPTRAGGNPPSPCSVISNLGYMGVRGLPNLNPTPSSPSPLGYTGVCRMA